jgi:sarcosine oxidase subunit alpha
VSRQRPLLVPARPKSSVVHLRFDEVLIEALPEDTLASALIAAGVLMTSRSPKYRRPRGPYCLGGDCGTCLVRVDGRPNVRACMTAVREGMRASSQNTYKPKRLDPTALVDALFPRGIDHHHFMVRPRVVNQVMQEFARNLTGLGDLPEGVSERSHEYLAHELPVLIIGAGPAGQAAAAALDAAGVEHVVVDRHPQIQLDANLPAELDGQAAPARLLCNTGVFAVYPGPRHAFPDGADELALVAASELHEQTERVHGFRPRHLLFCMGSRDPMLPFVNDDLPGVVAARGLIRALRRADARIAGSCVVVGEGEWAQRCRDELDELRSSEAPKVELVEPELIERAHGGERVEALICRNARHSCALLAVAAPPAPAHELAAQAGAPLHFDGSGFAITREEPGRARCGELGGTQLWAAGDVCGWQGPEAAARDGARVAAAILEALAAAPEQLTQARRFAPAAPPGPPLMRERTVVGDRFAEPAADPAAGPAKEPK